MTTLGLCFVLALLLLLGTQAAAAPDEEPAPQPGVGLTDAQVTKFARVALAGITREYPNAPGLRLAGPESLKTPRELHPAFYGCFDWHSAVHGHWTLVRLLKLHPKWTELRAEVVAALDGNLTAENLKKETAYFDPKMHRSFERTYGWAWLYRLAQELRTWDDDLGRRWAKNVAPLEARLVELMKAYLPKLSMPIRSGTHGNTAFALAFTIDYARAVGDEELEKLAASRAKAFYAKDSDYPVRYEPSGYDFFSAALNEADLMRRVLEGKAYDAWLDGFLPGLKARDLSNVAKPASVSDVTDGHLVHLAGLNLTRGWTMRGIAAALPEDDPRRAYLEELVKAHTKAGLGYVFSGHYAGEHWLASFAVYLLTDAGRTQ